MDHDEQHLIVLRPLRQRTLERQQIVDPQIFAVRRHDAVSDWLREASRLLRA
jgi:hypothetical protein